MLEGLSSPLMSPLWHSMICGAIIGFERELKRKDAGIKTTMLICVGACIFTFISFHIPGAKDSSRVLSQIVVGVGFLGGGVIFKNGENVTGLTSAAMIWLTAAIGCLCGLGMFYEALMTAITMCSIDYLFDQIKEYLRRRE